MIGMRPWDCFDVEGRTGGRRAMFTLSYHAVIPFPRLVQASGCARAALRYIILLKI